MNKTHGLSKTPTWWVWHRMKLRCYCKTNQLYPRYGGRGIYMCEEWRNDYTAFLRDMGQRPAGMSIDRINNDGPYSKENCRWATWSQQRRNQRLRRAITFNGERKCLRDWERSLGLGCGTLWRRIAKGVPLEMAMTPKRGRK